MVDARNLPEEVMLAAMGRPIEEHQVNYEALMDMIPQYARVQIPFNKINAKSALANCADLLRGLATSLDLLSRRSDLSSAHALFIAHAEIKSTNGKMQLFTRDSKRG